MLLPILAMAAIVVASNIGVQFLIADGWLTWGAFSYPLAFLVTDVTNRLHGPDRARRVVLWGFAVGLVCSLIGTQIQGEFGPLVTWRIALASGTAFLVAQLIDLGVFSALRDRVWYVAPLTSSVVGSVVDTAIFFTIAFAGFLAFPAAWGDVSWAQEATAVGPLWVGLALADWSVKIGVALLALVPFRLITGKMTQKVA
ncbi:queuosine precursor transporter [Jannaschia ovalis]|uniref:Probable queuosine precursor transporter n=1 Tax=Jannaschia ovalis TaxID=3038773 RepID=A0ABY8LDQ1_9RHOB|nr:queuosine precursor transporter [Jannaschia sp. GRR-S6-38]WGH79449.1 queuosine precursor transporter [Jannaschia sp. GRR-S6-38]